MRRLLLLAAVVLTLTGPAGSFSRADLKVTTGADGAPGSLRDLVENKAKPGDVIKFDTALRVELRRPLVVRKALTGLVIDGGTATGGKAEIAGVRTSQHAYIRVDADRVTLRNLKLTNAAVDFAVLGAAGEVEGPLAPQIVDVEAVIDAGWVLRPALSFDFARQVRITGGRVSGGIFFTGARGAQVTGVALAARRASGLAVSDLNSERLVIRGNMLESGRISLQSQGATVAENTVRAGGTLDVWIVEGGTGSVERNTLEGGRIVAQAGGAVGVTGNTVTGAWRRGPGLPGISVGCATDGDKPELDVRGNRVTGRRIGMLLDCRRDAAISIGPNTLERNGFGMLVTAREVKISGVTVRENAGAGIAVGRGPRATITRIAAGGNGGLGIDRDDAEPRPAKMEYDKKKGRIRGVACRNCVVELYEAEEGDEPGEGLRYLATVKAASSGAFVYPTKGKLNCPPTGRITATATDPKQKRTSEFSADVECKCVVSSDFVVRGAPRTGFANYGLTVAFPPGVKLGEVTLTDATTEKRPGANDLGPLLRWQEFQNVASGSGREHDFFVNVTYRDPNSPAEPAPVRKVWHYTLQYDPPKGQTACKAVLVAAWEPVK